MLQEPGIFAVKLRRMPARLRALTERPPSLGSHSAPPISPAVLPANAPDTIARGFSLANITPRAPNVPPANPHSCGMYVSFGFTPTASELSQAAVRIPASMTPVVIKVASSIGNSPGMTS